MVPWMGSSPMAEVCLSGRGGGDLSDFGEQGVKGNRYMSNHCISGKSQRDRVWGSRENVDFVGPKVQSFMAGP